MIGTKTKWLTLADKDSQRFKKRIVRGCIENIAPSPGELINEIHGLRADVAILRMPAGMIAPIYELIEKGFVPIHADTLVHHSRRLNTAVIIRGERAGLTVERASPGDGDRIAAIARDAFASYRSHYHANPLFDSAQIAEGYADWAVSFLRAHCEDRETWVARVDGEVAGFATCALSNSNTLAEIVLNAVAPEHAGNGIYGFLVSYLLRSYKTRGFSVVSSSTQVWNYTVQKAWTRAEFVITKAYDTYHIITPSERVSGC